MGWLESEGRIPVHGFWALHQDFWADQHLRWL